MVVVVWLLFKPGDSQQAEFILPLLLFFFAPPQMEAAGDTARPAVR